MQSERKNKTKHRIVAEMMQPLVFYTERWTLTLMIEWQTHVETRVLLTVRFSKGGHALGENSCGEAEDQQLSLAT